MNEPQAPEWKKWMAENPNYWQEERLWFYAIECPTCKAEAGRWCRGAPDEPPCIGRVRVWEAMGRPLWVKPKGTAIPELYVKMLEAALGEEA